MRSLRKTVSFVALLFIVEMIVTGGCSPVPSPPPTLDIAATIEAAVAATLASQSTPDIPATIEAAVAVALASQPTPDVAATVEAAVATEMAATQTAQVEQAATPTPVPPAATPEPTDTSVPPPPTPTVTPTNTPMPTLCVIGESRICCTDNGGGETEIISVEPPRTVDQIRIDLEERATGYGFSLWEVRAYGPDTGNTNLVIGGDANASTEQDSPGCIGCFAYNAIDGDMNTRWSSDWKDEQSLEIDLPDPQVVNRIVLRWEQAYARKYCVTVIEP